MSGTSPREIRRKELLHCCKLCPDEQFAISPKSKRERQNKSVEGHVEKKHPGLDYRTLTRKWGYRVRYTDGSVKDIPLATQNTQKPSNDSSDANVFPSDPQLSNPTVFLDEPPRESISPFDPNNPFRVTPFMTDYQMPQLQASSQTASSLTPLQYNSAGPAVFSEVPYTQLHQLDQAALAGQHGEDVANLALLALFGNDENDAVQPRTREEQLMDMIRFLRLQRDWYHEKAGDQGMQG